MDPALMKAAEQGDVKFLKKAVAKQPSSYFLAQNYWGNIVHIAAKEGKVEFLKEAMNILPKDLQKQLLLQTRNNEFMYTLLHVAARSYKIDIVVLIECIKEMYESLSWDDEDHVKPWLALNGDNETPLNLILSQSWVPEKSVMEIMLMDPEHDSWTIADKYGKTPLHNALKNGYNLVVQNILKSIKEAFALQPCEYFFPQSMGENVFHVAADKGNVEFLKEAMNILPTAIQKQFLLQTTDINMYTVLHCAALHRDVTLVKFIREMYASFSWVDEDHVKPWLALTSSNNTPLHHALGLAEADEECAMEILLMDPELVSCTIADAYGNTPLYYAVKKGLNQVAENILMSPLPATSIISSSNFLELVNLAATNCSGNVERLLWEKYGGCLDDDGNTSLHSALNSLSAQELALENLSTYPGLCKIRNNRGESPFFLAVKSGSEQVMDEIMRIDDPRFHMLRRNDGTTVLHSLSSCPESTGKRLLEKYWWLINLRDDHGKTALDYAKQANAAWLVNLLTKPSLLHKEDIDWIEACKREEFFVVSAFVESCEDLQRACLLKNDTPLHHLKLNTYIDYLNFLKNPFITEIKNMTDHYGATPLHRALERKDIKFVTALLRDDEVRKTIKDYYGRTPMDLLAKLCKENNEWDRMCKLVKVNPHLKTSYIQAGDNLIQIRNTLSVVAALLATITFAAGFTLPGGLNSDNGEAFLVKKASFLVFLLADVYAMCTSMLVLFCLIWSMVSERDMARLLVDRSVFLLMQSLYGTLLAFMTAIYTVIAHKSLWAAILIFVMCSIIGISINRTILHTVIAKLVPAANKQDQMRLLEEGNGGDMDEVQTNFYPGPEFLLDASPIKINSYEDFIFDNNKKNKDETIIVIL